MANNKILLAHGERLGIRDSTVILKADALLRTLNSKPSSKTISDTARIVLCLDLAATHLSASFDKDTALKLTGLRKTVYQNSLNNVEKILNLDKPLSVSEICVQLSCPEAKEMATTILNSYQETDTKIKDIQHPQYAAAAVYTSCKLNGIKVDKTKFKLLSRLKVGEWNELVEEFGKFVATLGLTGAKKRRTKTAPAQVESMEEDVLAETKAHDKEEVVEAYEVWRERILREASEEILKREVNE